MITARLAAFRCLLAGLAALVTHARAALAQGAPDWTQRPALGPERAFSPPAIERAVLSNGMPVLFVARAGVPLIQINLVVKGGSTDDPPGRFGLAALAAELMDDGAGSRSGREIAASAELLGVNLTVRADRQSVQVLLTSPVGRVDSALGLMSDVALRPTYPDDEVRKVRARQLTWIERLPEHPSNLAAIALSRALFGDAHPDGQSSLGTGRGVAAIVRADLVTFHRAAFRPDRAALVVVGETSLAEIQPRLEAAFGRPWRGVGSPAAPTAAPPEGIKSRAVTLVDYPGAAQSTLRVVALGPARSSPDYFALEVLNMTLGGSTTSRIGQNLRARHGFTYEARSMFEWRRVASPFIAYADVETKVTAAAVRELIREIGSIRAEITAEEVVTAKNLLRRSMPQPFMTVRGVAGLVGEIFLAGLPLDYHASYAQHLEAVTAADLMRVARAYIVPERMAVVIVGDRAVIENEIRELDLGPVKVLQAGDLVPDN